MALCVEIRVSPSSGKSQCQLDKAGRLKCFLKSPPERGAANKELIKILAQALRVPLANVTIITGLTSRTKTIKIDTSITYEELLQKLGIEKQETLW